MRNRPIVSALLSRALGAINRPRLRCAVERLSPLHMRLTVFIFTENLLHFAPFCISKNLDRSAHLIVLNGVSKENQAWIRSILPGYETVALRASLTNNPNTLLSHAEVLDGLLRVIAPPFCIQDPDCFILDPAFYDQVPLDPARHYASGPFVSERPATDRVVPYTYFLQLNAPLYRELSHRYGVGADIASSLSRRAAQAVRRAGYGDGVYPEIGKRYFDTLQLFFALAEAQGLAFHRIEGARDQALHIGGTSYLGRCAVDVTAGDFWPLSVIYINLRLLEQPVNARFKNSFSGILETYRSSDRLLNLFPEFARGHRYRTIHRILDRCVK